MKTLLASVAISGALATVLLSVSAPACGCKATDVFGSELEIHSVPGYTPAAGLSAEAVAAAANRKYVGTPLATLKTPEAMRKGDCARSGPSLECTYVVASGYVREEQLRMRFLAGADGKVERVEVAEARKWGWN